MTSAPTHDRPSRQDRQAPPRNYDPVPTHLRKWRALWTAASLIGSFGGAGWSAFALGTGDDGELYAAMFLIVFGLLSAYVANRPGWYTGQAVAPAWMRRTRTVTIDAEARPAPRPRPRPRPEKAPTQNRTAPVAPRPAPDLGENFTYIVLLVRRLVEKGRTDELAMMERFYGAMWDADVGEDVVHPYRDAVELVRNIATEYGTFVPRDHANFNGGDLRNPEVFLAELDQVSEAAAAVAALMLVRDDVDVDEEVFGTVMVPWKQARLPYRSDNIRYTWSTSEGTYCPVEIPNAAPPIPKLVGPDELIAQRRAAQPAPPAPAPAPAPAARVTVDLDDETGYQFSVNQLVHATELFVTSQFGSTSMIGRKLRLGFATCGRIVDRLVELGILGKQETDSGRAVLVHPDQLAEAKRYVVEMEIDRRQG